MSKDSFFVQYKNQILKILLSVVFGGASLAAIIANNFENQIQQKIFHPTSELKRNISSEKKIYLSVLKPILFFNKISFQKEELTPLTFTTAEEILLNINNKNRIRRKIKILENSKINQLLHIQNYIVENIRWERSVLSQQSKKILKDSVVQVLSALNKEEKINSIINVGVIGNQSARQENYERKVKEIIQEDLKKYESIAETKKIETKLNPNSNPNSKTVLIKGKIANTGKSYPGHFEVGFYKGITIEGNPVGSPSPQAILKNGDLEFSLNIPRNLDGYIFARFFSSEKNSNIQEWHGYPVHFVFNEIKDDNLAIIIPVRLKNTQEEIATKKNIQEISITTKIGAMFSEKGKFIPLDKCIVKLRGTKHEAISDENGIIHLKLPKTEGKILLEFSKPGYLPQIVELALNGDIHNYQIPFVELASKEAIKHMAHSLNIHLSNIASVVIIDMKTKGNSSGLPGISAQISLRGDGPFYFSEKGFPQANLKATTMDGRIIFFNVAPGVGILEPFVLGAAISPIIISSMGMGDLLYQQIDAIESNAKIIGKVLDPVNQNLGNPQAVAGARVKLVGSSEWTETDLFGSFQLPGNKFIKNVDHLIEVSKPGYFNHRYKFKMKDNAAVDDLSLYLFSTKYITKLANSVDIPIDPNYGILIGKVDTTEKIKIDMLADHSAQNEAKDFYFDARNMIQGGHAYTDPEFGTYVVFKVPTGRDILQGYNKKGEIRYYNTSYFSPGTVNVLVE